MQRRGKCRHCLAPECSAELSDMTENEEGEIICCKKYESPALAGVLFVLAMINFGFWDLDGYRGWNLLATSLLLLGAAIAFNWPGNKR